MTSNQIKWLKRVARIANGLHVALYRVSKGKIGGEAGNVPLLLITTYGRKSGRPRTNPVGYLRDGQDYLVSGSFGGLDIVPAWFLNLKTNPRARVEFGGTAFDVRAVIAEGEERDRLFAQFKAASSNFVKYEQTAHRVIPVIRLTPVDVAVQQQSVLRERIQNG